MKTQIVWQNNEMPFGITLEQTGKDRFRVIYGKQVDSSLTYSKACQKLGEVMMHSLACDGKIVTD